MSVVDIATMFVWVCSVSSTCACAVIVRRERKRHREEIAGTAIEAALCEREAVRRWCNSRKSKANADAPIEAYYWGLFESGVRAGRHRRQR